MTNKTQEQLWMLSPEIISSLPNQVYDLLEALRFYNGKTVVIPEIHWVKLRQHVDIYPHWSKYVETLTNNFIEHPSIVVGNNFKFIGINWRVTNDE